jgi:hypothetical protein
MRPADVLGDILVFNEKCRGVGCVEYGSYNSFNGVVIERVTGLGPWKLLHPFKRRDGVPDYPTCVVCPSCRV